MLAVFVLVGFCQYCAWNIYGPIATTAKTVFKWSNSEIAILANMDPITHILTMMAFSKLMDTKGLRTTMLVSVAFMAIGTGLRCVTSDPRYCIWSMSVGQFLNGLGGPIAQAGPTLLTSYWFPPSQRATATAVASMAGSFGLAMSFLISPGFVTDVKKELDALNPKPLNHSANINSILARYTNTTVPLKDSVYFEAKHYWPLDKLKIKSTNTIMKSVRNSSNTTSSPTRSTEVMSKVIDIKSHQEGFAFGRIQLGPGVINQSVLTNGQNAWLNLGDFRNTCLSEPSLCDQGLTVSFWIRYHPSQQHLQFFMGTSGTQHGDRGFLVYQDTNNHLSIKVENSKLLWERSFTAPSDTWLHVMFTWDSKEGLSVYLNGSLVGVDEQGKATYPISPYFTTLTVGRPNDVKVFCNASFDEIAVWYRKLRQVEIQSIYNRLINKKPIDEMYEKAKEKLLDKARNEIMMLLYIEFGVVAMLFIVVVIYFPNKPPSPPSKSAQEKREDFLPGLKMIFRNLQFWKLALLYGVTTGVYSGWGALLAVNLEKFDIPQIQVGWIGFFATLAGIASAIVVGRIADKWDRQMKKILVFLIFGSTMCFLWFLLLYLKAFPFEYFSLYLSNIFGGIFVNGAIPICYELAVETTYPVGPGVTTGLLTLINNFFTVVFLAVEIIPGVGTVWMNWFMLFACAVCIPIMFTFRENYHRRDVDEGRQPAAMTHDN